MTENELMEQAIEISKQANCIKGKVGALIVKENNIIASGNNSVPNGITPCTEKTCIRKKLKLKSGENQELCFVVHAEQNALLYALNNNINVKNSTLYVTKSPCIICTKLLINAGIKEIIYLQEYPDKYAFKLLDEAKIKYRKYEKIPS